MIVTIVDPWFKIGVVVLDVSGLVKESRHRPLPPGQGNDPMEMFV